MYLPILGRNNMPRKAPTNWSDPWTAPWPQVSRQLRRLQIYVGSYKGRFADAGRQDIADDLERCIHLLKKAEGTAATLGAELP